MTLADRIVVLRDGRIEQIGRPLDLYDDPANQFVAGFVGSPRMNFLAAEVVAREGGDADACAGQPGRRAADAAGAGRSASATGWWSGVRPEHFRRAGEGDCDLVVAVDVAEHLGSTSYVYANTKVGEQLVDRARGIARRGRDRPADGVDPGEEGISLRCGRGTAEMKEETMERQGETTVATKLRWGILGPGTIARTFAGGVAHSRLGTVVAIGARDPGRAGYAEALPRRARGGRLRGAARRPGGRGGLYRHAASAPRRVGDQGGRGRQARAGREAARADRARGRRDLPRGAPRRHLHGRGVHVPAASADREAPRADRRAARSARCG